MSLNEYYSSILEEHKKDYAFLTRLEVCDNLNGMGTNLSDFEKSYLIKNIADYWLHSELWEHTLFDVTELAVSNNLARLSGGDLEHEKHNFFAEMDKSV